ncbi:hypothetical protein FD04_GL000673 [Secundilactobacillus odoratitofui DSM 19909 = JCM 15043]|uniref:Uncharacterized protein n=1 Tax=Secundilactobacillus odoratitofui DSM 19909 = JCM 15043 TaxID=1423776 RepID=A0A0R1LTY7_9LACO|nr:hypothetical protein [Secundilactobacillus odoratitofui]KRK98928.1 hypothetical protein FD04_GL000673 [Secundilactobacillus odoratitofui DSM 19909 = JCM 15043]
MLQPGVVLFDQLSESAKQRAVRDFIDFYLNKYQSGSLEILTDFPIQYEMEQINHDIQQNISFHPEQLRQFLSENDGHLFAQIISALHESFMENGVMAESNYEEWYQKQYDAIKPGL